VATDTTSGNSVTSSVVALIVHAAAAPQFSVTPTPTNLVTFVGGSVIYSATEVGTLPITNQWRFDNGGGYVSLTSQTNTTLALSNLQLTNTGTYQLAATNVVGNASTAVTLTVLPAPPAPVLGQKYFNAVYTNNPWAYWRLNETNDPTAPGAPTYRAYDYSGHNFNPTYGNAVTVNNPGPQTPTFPGFDASELAAGTTVSTPNAYLTVPALNLAGSSNVTFMAWINPNGAQAASAGLLFNRGGPDVACGFGFGATQDHLGYTWNNNALATYSWDSGLAVADNQWNFVAYVITPTNATVYLANLSGGTTNFSQAVNPVANTPETFAGGSLLLGGDSSSLNRSFYGLMAEATVFTNALTTAQLQQYFLTAIGAAALPVVVGPAVAAPSANVYSGQNVLLSATVSGSAPLTNQWQVSSDSVNWSNIPGATNATLLINPQTVGTFYYQLSVANATGSSTGAPVSVTFSALPVYPSALWTASFQVTNNLDGSQNTGGGLGHYVGRGAVGNGTYWNILPQVLPAGSGYNSSSIVSVTDLLDDGVTHSGVFCQMNSGGGYNGPGTALPYSSDIGNLLGQWFRTYYSAGAVGNGALQFVGAPAGTYNVVCYGGSGLTRNGSADLGSTYVVFDAVNGNQTNSTAAPSPTTALAEGVNFATFTNVHISGTLNVDVLANPATGGGAIISGAQLQLVSYDPPTAVFTGTPTNVLAAQTVTFTNASAGAITNAVWTFGDGTSVTNSSNVGVSHSYASSGTYTVSLSVSGPGGGPVSQTRTGYIVVVSNVPISSTATLAGGKFILSGANGTAGAQYRILTTTNLTLPVTNWIPVITNVFLPDGTYSYTNSSVTNAASFFRLVTP
jgi:PKD repeat protein